MAYAHHYNPSSIYALASGGYRHGNNDDDNGHSHGGCGCNGGNRYSANTPNACCHQMAEEAPCPCPHSCANDCVEAQVPPQVCCHPAAFHRTRDTVAVNSGNAGGYHNIHVAYGTTRPAW